MIKFIKKTFLKPKLDSNYARGMFGEKLARKHLKHNGYKIVEKNWRHKNDEIDIIAKNNNTLVFVEVRSREKNATCSGYHTVNKKKKDKLLRICKYYLKKFPHKHFRFDIIEVKLCNEGNNLVNHYTNIPLFSKHFQ